MSQQSSDLIRSRIAVGPRAVSTDASAVKPTLLYAKNIDVVRLSAPNSPTLLDALDTGGLPMGKPRFKCG